MQGYGLADLAKKTPVTADTAFDLASVSKQFTSMAVMILAERGKLSYDDPVKRWIEPLYVVPLYALCERARTRRDSPRSPRSKSYKGSRAATATASCSSASCRCAIRVNGHWKRPRWLSRWRTITVITPGGTRLSKVHLFHGRARLRPGRQRVPEQHRTHHRQIGARRDEQRSVDDGLVADVRTAVANGPSIKDDRTYTSTLLPRK